jgi:hypothetical protein
MRRGSKWLKAKTQIKGLAHAAAVLKTIPHGVDSSTFFGAAIPAEVREAVPVMHDTAAPLFAKTLEAVVMSLKDEESAVHVVSEVSAAFGAENAENFAKLFTGLSTLVKTAVRNHTKVTVIEADLSAMNVPVFVIDAFLSLIRASRFQLLDAAAARVPAFPTMTGCRWRVDVNISGSDLSRDLQPRLMMEMTQSNGDVRTFEVPLSKFHQLRYCVAKSLRDMREVQQHPVMKIAFDTEKAKIDEAMK